MTSKRNGKAASAPKAAPQDTSSEPIKGPGRPAGSKNKEYADVKYFPPTCPECNSENYKRVDGSAPIVHEIYGTDPDGFAYRKIHWQRSVCLDCGQHFNVKGYYRAK